MTEENEGVIGIDLGTNVSSVAVWTNGRPVPLPPVPSTVAFAGTSVLFGEAAAAQSHTNPNHTIPSVLTFLGQRLDEARRIVETETEHSMIAIAQSTRTNQNARPVIVVGESDGDPDDTNVRAALSFAPEEVAALFLRHLKELAENRLGSPVSKAVIAVPSGFNNAQRSAVRNAGAIAGLDVLRLINAPTAAVVACNFPVSGDSVGGVTGSEPHNTNATTDEGRNIAVVDFGAGHFEVSVINVDEGVFDVKSTAHHRSLSGAAIDQTLAQHFSQQFQRSQPSPIDVSSNDLQRRLIRACRRAKENLTDSLETRLPIVEFCDTRRELPDDDGHGAPELFWEQQTLTRSSFMEICGGLFDEIIPTIKMALCDAKLDKRAVDQVLLVGGCTLIPTVRTIVADFFSGVPIVIAGTSGLGGEAATSHRSKQAIACGAAIQGSLLLPSPSTDDGAPSLDLKDALILEGTARSIGIETAGGVMSSVFKRNTTVPITSTQMFTTYCDSAQAPLLRVFEGERLLSKDNTLTGSYSLRGVPPAPRQVPRIHVTFHLDADGILTVSAVDKTDGDRERDIAVMSDTGALSAAEVQRMAQRNSQV